MATTESINPTESVNPTTKRISAEANGDTPAKKAKPDSGEHPAWRSLAAFQFVKLLKEDSQSKMICVQAKAKRKSASGEGDQDSEADAIILMEKSAFDSSKIDELLSSETAVEKVFNNDIYGTYSSNPRNDLNSESPVYRC